MSILLFITKIWRPDIVLYNNVGEIIEANTLIQVNLRLFDITVSSLLLQVWYDGNVTWLTQGIYTSKCEINVKYYPMDAQNCSLKFASWSQEVTKVRRISKILIDDKNLQIISSSI